MLNRPKVVRVRLDDERPSITHHAVISSEVMPPTDIYIIVGCYSDGSPGEVFIKVGKEGSSMNGMVRAWATLLSMSLQCGVELSHIVEKFRGWRFEPSGNMNNPEIPVCSSIVDYVVRWLAIKFGGQKYDS